MSGMAEVLAAHQRDHGKRTLHEHCSCGWFGQVLGGDFTTHQAAMLAAAGFGPVKEAGAVAPHLKKVRGELKSFGKNLDSWESQGHTTVTIRNLRQVVARMDAAIRADSA